MSHDEYRSFARDALKEHLKAGEYHDDEVETFLARLFYVAVDARSEKGWPELKALLDAGQGPGPGVLSRRRAGAVRRHPRRSARTGWSPTKRGSWSKNRSAAIWNRRMR
jgi:hypothetical protein